MVARTNKKRVLDYLWSIAPDAATNRQIREATGIEPHQQVYMLTQDLKRQGMVASERRGREWFFSVDESLSAQMQSPGRAHSTQVQKAASQEMTPRRFELLARRILSEHYGVPLREGEVAGVPKRFDLVAHDGEIAGDAKYYTLVRGQYLPPAKFATIAEHLWLLEKTQAPRQFLVFGNDPEVPRLWLARYGHLVSTVTFYFLDDEGGLTTLLDN